MKRIRPRHRAALGIRAKRPATVFRVPPSGGGGSFTSLAGRLKPPRPAKAGTLNAVIGIFALPGIVLLALACRATVIVGQAQSKPEMAITGRVLLEDGQPAGGARIEAHPVGAFGGWQGAICDEAGNFNMPLRAAGSYKLEVSAPGFVLDSRSATDNLYHVGDSVKLRLVKGGVITGRVVDVAGEPLVGIGVSLYRVRDVEGNRLREDSARAVDAQTDDRGIYRAFGLQPGAYIIGAEVSAGGNKSGRDVPTWFPSATRDTAAEVTVHAGEEITGTDIRHRGDTGFAVSGTVSGNAESSPPFAGVSLTLLSAATKEPIARGGTTESKSFVLFGLSDGEYELYAQSFSEDGYAAASPLRHVTIRGADVTGLELKLVKFGSIAGRVMVEPAAVKCGGKNRAAAEEILLRARGEGRNPRSLNTLGVAADSNPGQVAPNEKGEFTIKGLEADGYRLETDLPGETWYVRSVTQPGQPATGAAKKLDAARQPINLKPSERLSGVEITVAEGAASLSGQIVPAEEGRKLPARLRIHLIPAEATAADDVLRYREMTAGQGASFAFKHLSPGKYWLLARDASESEANNEQPRAAVLDANERAKLRREAEAAKNEISLQPCQRAKDVTAKFAVTK